jgi:hypothetical protein
MNLAVLHQQIDTEDEPAVATCTWLKQPCREQLAGLIRARCRNGLA